MFKHREVVMPFLEPVSDQQASPAAKEIFDDFKARIKMVPNIYRTMAHAPVVLAGSLAFNKSFHSGLDPKLRELAYIKASMLNECHY